MSATISIPFDAFTLAAVAADLRATLVGARVQKIQQPTASDLILSVYGRHGAHRLLICADPKQFRVHRTVQKRENPVTPPAFCLLCRKWLDGAFVTDVVQPRFDRVLHLYFGLAGGVTFRLILELMGRNTNVVLVDGANIVRGMQRPVPADSERPLRVNQPYTEPPGYREKVDPFDLTGPDDAIFAELPSDQNETRLWLASTFSGLGKFGTGEILARSQEQSVAVTLWKLMQAIRNEAFAPHDVFQKDEQPAHHVRMPARGWVGVWAFEPLTVPTVQRYPRENISLSLDAFYATQAETTFAEAERTRLSKVLTREITFRKRELASARNTLMEAARADEYEQTGNNLLAALYKVERGMASVTVPDLYDEEAKEITVTLDPKKSPQENAEAFFVRARKARDAAEYAEGQIVDRTHELSQLTPIEAEIPGADGQRLRELRQQLTAILGEERLQTAEPSQQRVAPKEKPFGGYRIRTFPVDGYTLLIGETAEANDYLTTRIASPSDWWFHVRSAPGAHGVLRTQGKPDRVPETVLRKAAALVAARSGTAVKHASVVAVDMVEKRHVRKPRGAKPGLVTYDRERTLDVTPAARN